MVRRYGFEPGEDRRDPEPPEPPPIHQAPRDRARRSQQTQERRRITGELTDVDEKFHISFLDRRITVQDEQSTPVTRVRLGRLGSGDTDYGLEVFDASGNSVLSATGLGVDSVGTNQIQDGAVTEPKVGDGAITTPKLDSLAVTEAKIDDAAVELSTKVTGLLQEANAVAALRNINVTVNSDGTLSGAGGGQVSIADLPGLVDGETQIADLSIVGTLIATREIAARHLFVGSFDNLIQNPGFEQDATLDPHSVVTDGGGGGFSVVTTAPRSGANHVLYDPTGQTSSAVLALNGPRTNEVHHFAATEGDKLYAEVHHRAGAAGSANQVDLRFAWLDESGSLLGTSSSDVATPTTSYARLSHSATAPAGTAYALPQVAILNDGHGNDVYLDDFYARRRLTGELIVDGEIVADHISSISLSVLQAEVGTLSALTANMGTLTAGSIVIGSTNRIWLNDSGDGGLHIGGSTKGSAPFSVDATGALTATGATVDGVVTINAGSTGVQHLGDAGDLAQLNEVTDSEINVGSLSAISADMGSLDAGSIVITDGSNTIWLNDGSDGAIHVGGTTKGSAPFSVDAAGNLTATSATITGTITASSVVAATSFTASTMTAEGIMILEANQGSGNDAIQLRSNDGGHITFHDTSGVQQAAVGYITSSDLFLMDIDAGVGGFEIRSEGPININSNDDHITIETQGTGSVSDISLIAQDQIKLDATNIVMVGGLPTTDPGITGALYQDGVGNVQVSF